VAGGTISGNESHGDVDLKDLLPAALPALSAALQAAARHILAGTPPEVARENGRGFAVRRPRLWYQQLSGVGREGPSRCKPAETAVEARALCIRAVLGLGRVGRREGAASRWGQAEDCGRGYKCRDFADFAESLSPR
jgi:hypothetical protein